MLYQWRAENDSVQETYEQNDRLKEELRKLHDELERVNEELSRTKEQEEERLLD